MRSFHFVRAYPECPTNTFHVSINHNGDWSGNVEIFVVVAPPVADPEAWYTSLSNVDRNNVQFATTIKAIDLLHGDVDQAAMAVPVARVIGAVIAQCVARHLHDKAIAAAETVWLPSR